MLPIGYATLSYVPIAALLALALALVAATDTARVPRLAALLFVLPLLPIAPVTRTLAARDGRAEVDDGIWAERGFEPWLVEVVERSRALRGPAPGAVIVFEACSAAERVEVSRTDVEVYAMVVGSEGIQWATGWYDADVCFGADCPAPPELRPPVVAISHCIGSPPRLEIVVAATE